MPDDKNQWYSNKDIFERFMAMSIELQELRGEMRETRTLIKQYNGLREEIEKVKKDTAVSSEKIKTILSVQSGRSGAFENLRNWGGWVFGLITLIILLYNQLT